ncbi:MAG: thiol:disulfide interchange protein DsbA/DsbL [Methylotenera sp.]|nr:thiol:disulfide interchange protein DsbA/DsbL [Methylotenera sp.]MDP2281775.1 thiol:disulfide interchange protein DsbA/DsbL [Methylotenera sp.]MDP3059311.1 thiol:disulfide interchange protein DsbA/DsbL [Methylotenera sp.]
MKKLLTALMLLASFNVMADPQLGKDFDKTAQVITSDTPNKIEVIELFWYGCGHCHQMEAPLSAWVKKFPADVVFKRVPGLPQPAWAPMAKAYYAMETLGVLEKLHAPLFEAIHTKKTLKPTDEKAAIDWVTKQAGLDKKKVEEAFGSFSTNTSLNRAANIFRASGATGVPSLIIDGQFITSSTMAGNNDAALKTADYIIANIRADKARATTPAKK